MLPIVVGMIVKHFAPDLAAPLARWLRPTAFVILVVVIAFSVRGQPARWCSTIWSRATPAIFALNLAAMAFGLLLGRLLGAGARDAMTLAIETGVQNVTLAIFLTLTVLGSLPLAVTQNIYGVVMILNASLLIRWWRGPDRRRGAMTPLFVSAEEVARLLPYEECIPLMREAMIALSRRADPAAAALDPRSAGGPRLRGDARRDARRRHVRGQAGQRLSRQFRAAAGRRTRAWSSCSIAETGAPSAILEAGEITAIRTAAASAAATDALARPDARHLAILGYGEQARRHVEAIRCVRADRAGHDLGPRSRQGRRRSAARRARASRRRSPGADIICTVTAARRADPAKPLGRRRRPCQRGRIEPRRPGRDRQ